MNEKLVYIGSNIPDKTPAGVRVFANALALRDYGYNVKLISRDIDCLTDFDINDGIETWHLRRPTSTKGWMKTLVDANSYTGIIDRIDNVKAVIAYELPAIAFLRLRKYCKNKGIKLFCETAEWQRWENLGSLGFIARLVRILDINMSMHHVYKKGDGIIVTSSFFKDHFKKHLPTLALPTLQCHKLSLPTEIDINPVRKFIYAGGLGYKKDMLHEILHAFGEVRERYFEFDILGLTREDYLERFVGDKELLDQINRSKERISFEGKKTHREVLEEVSKSDFEIIIRESSHRNNMGFPTKFGESINCGTPVIVSDFSDVVYYTEKYGVGIVTTIDNIVKSIQEALDMSDEHIIEMKQRCRVCDAFYYKGHVKEIGDFVRSCYE